MTSITEEIPIPRFSPPFFVSLFLVENVGGFLMGDLCVSRSNLC